MNDKRTNLEIIAPTIEEAIELVKQSTIVNMVGKCVVRHAVKAGLVHPEAVLKIDGVPHAQIVKI